VNDRDRADRATAAAAAVQDPVALLQALYPRLLATAQALEGPKGRAEDLVQQALVETLVRYPDFAGLVHPLGYVRTVLFRLHRSRRSRDRWEVPLDIQELVERDADPIDAVEGMLDHLLLHQALTEVGRKQRACLVLRYLYGLTESEIAILLGCGRSTVRSQIARALKRLRASLGAAKIEVIAEET
jgi:RNA polymerase sigma factor (sigma-70 family)